MFSQPISALYYPNQPIRLRVTPCRVPVTWRSLPVADVSFCRRYRLLVGNMNLNALRFNALNNLAVAEAEIKLAKL